MIVIDWHTHFYPAEIAKNIEAWAQDNFENYWLKLVGKRADGKPSLQSFPSIREFLNAMDAAEVEKACIQGWYWQHSKTAQKANKQIAEIVEKYSDRLFAYACINPAEKTAIKDLETARDMGFCGVGELHDGVQNFKFSSEKFDEFCKRCAELNFPICLHLTDPKGRDYPNKILTSNMDAYEAARRNPQTNFIFAHFGGGDIFDSIFTAPKNVFYDCAANTFLYGKKGFEDAPKAVREKLLFGSDFPLRLYPKKYKTAEMREFVKSVMEIAPDIFSHKI